MFARKFSLPIFLFLFSTSQVLVAQNFTVSGRLQDGTTKGPLEFASVAVLQQKDSSLVTGALSDEKGAFSISLKPGSYLLRATFIGYTDLFRPFTISNGPVALGTLVLNTDATTLQEVTVESVAMLFESDIDKRTFDVSNSIVAEGGTARDVLETLPSIQVDDQGGITMRGSGNIVVFVNGRPTSLSGDDTESILDQFPANSIQKVELITNPSSRYDATGVGGIINIILKKNQRTGLNGQVNASVGTRNKYTGGVNLNYGAGRVNYYTNYNYQYRQLFRESESLRQTSSQSTSPFLDQDSYQINTNINHTVRSGLDYQISDKSELGWYVSGNWTDRSGDETLNQRYQNIIRQQDSLTVRDQVEAQRRNNWETGLTYVLNIDTLGQKLISMFSFGQSNQDRTELYQQRQFDLNSMEESEKAIAQINQRPETNSQFVGQIDWEKPISNTLKIEAGLKTTLSRYDRRQEFLERPAEDAFFTRNDTVSDGFRFNEDVHAAYFIVRNKIGKFGYQAGLRGEYTLTNSFQTNTDSTFVNNYFNLFPSMYLSYNIGKEEEIQINYSRRISRPNMWNLAPFLGVSDPLNIRVGNPFLQPEFTDSYELSYLKGAKKNFFTGTVYHRRSRDIFTRLFTLGEGNVGLVTWQNANRRISTGLEVINQFNLTDWFDATLSGNFFHSEVIADNLEQNLSNSNFSWTLNLMTNIKLGKIATMQLQGNYRGPIVLPQGEIRPLYGLNIGVRKDVLKRKGFVSLNVSDVFNTRVFRIDTEGGNFVQERMFNRETQIATVAFTYRFGGFKDRNGRRDRGPDEYGDDF